jgi:hypothetical protein
LRFAACALLALSCWAAPARALERPPGYQFVSPLPGSALVSPRSALIVRQGAAMDPGSLDASRFSVSGSSSGPIAGSLVLSDDGRTLVFRPSHPFAGGERVQVQLLSGLRNLSGDPLPPLSFGFTAAPGDPRPVPAEVRDFPSPNPADVMRAAPMPSPNAGGLPARYPTVTLLQSNLPDSGAIFMAPFSAFNPSGRGNLVIVDNRGLPLFYRDWPTTAFDFKRQPDGRLTFFTGSEAFMVLDSTYAVVDSFRAGNGYQADEHDLQLLPNGHALILSYDPEPVEMEPVVPGGRPDAIVIGLIVQELDQSKNVVFQWRSWDHFMITDMDSCTGSPQDPVVDYVHGNAVELDNDGNLLISCRHMNEITKIDRQTGEIMWRFGAHAKHNEFTILDDPRGFSHQHDIRRQPNGHLTLFDNGNCLDPPYSRLLEYEVDEVNKVARLVWEYRHTPDVFGPFMGNQQRHDNGAITIGWGGTGPNPKMSEIHADGSTAFALGLAGPGVWTYRAFRFPWQTTAFSTDSAAFEFGKVSAGCTAMRTLEITNRSARPLTFNSFASTHPLFSVSGVFPMSLAPGETGSVTVTFTADSIGPITGDLYVRAVNDTELIARTVALNATGVGLVLSIDDLAQAEGDEGSTPFEFALRLDHPAVLPVTVLYTTGDSTATAAGNDYLPVSGQVTIGIGDSTAVIPVQVLGDLTPEPNELFTVTLLDATNAGIARRQAIGGILNDDDGVLAVVEAPLRFALHPMLPNPARDAATIGYDLPRAGHVTLEIFDLRGRRVATLVDAAESAGRRAVVWRTSGRPAGVYFARLTMGANRLTRKLELIR